MRKLTLQEMKLIAHRHGGECLSKRYISSQDKLRWQCENGHIWKALPSSIKQGFWCGKCFDDRRRDNIGEMQKIAAERGGRCLSAKYTNCRTHLKWECSKGHVWKATPLSVKHRSWCQKCAGTAKHSISEMRILAKKRGGRCLSKAYKDAHTKLHWECRYKHKWVAKPNGIIMGQWCPECSVFRMEKVVRGIFQQLFDKPFPRARPEWLISPLGKPLELDGYLKSRKVAFEYNGKQHYSNVGRFQVRFGSLEKRKKYDKLKKKACAARGIRLVVIPYNIKAKDLVAFIKAECQKQGICLPERKVDLESGNREIYATNVVSEMRVIAKTRGGRCLSKNYINSDTPLLWICKEGHKWKDPAWRIKQGKWCTTCRKISNHRVKEIKILNKLQRVAASRGGKCLAKNYKNSMTPILWECKDRHRWYASPGNVVSAGSWCGKCYWKSIKLKD